MKKLLLIVLIFLSCKQIGQNATIDGSKLTQFTMKDFEALKGDPKKQIETVNTLQTNVRMHFFKEFMNNLNIWIGPPGTCLFFLRNNKVIIYDEFDNYVNIGIWKFIDNNLLIEFEKKEKIGFKQNIFYDFSLSYSKGEKRKKGTTVIYLKPKKSGTIPEDKYMRLYQYIDHWKDKYPPYVKKYCDENKDICE